MRVRNDAQQVTATFSRNQHIAVGWRIAGQHVAATSRTMPMFFTYADLSGTINEREGRFTVAR